MIHTSRKGMVGRKMNLAITKNDNVITERSMTDGYQYGVSIPEAYVGFTSSIETTGAFEVGDVIGIKVQRINDWRGKDYNIRKASLVIESIPDIN